MKKKNYEEMNEAEKMIIDYLQIIKFQRTNSKVQYPPTDSEINLTDMAEKLHLL